MGDGANEILIQNSQIGKDIQVKASAGDDVVDILNSMVAGKLNISGGDGNNQAEIDGSLFGRDVQFKGGVGNNELFLANSLISGKVSLAAKAGNSVFDMSNTAVRRDVKVASKDGDDTVVINGGSHVDGKTSLSLGDGSNTITIDDVVFGGAIKFKVGNDVDIVNIERNGNPVGSTTQFRESVFSLQTMVFRRE